MRRSPSARAAARRRSPRAAAPSERRPSSRSPDRLHDHSVAAADGSFIEDLNALNGGYVDSDITWPHWAPTASNDYYWVVFSSERDYGHRVTRANSAPACVANGVLQCKQLWLGAIAKNKLTGGGVDPSAPPMWLPGQDIAADNISPFWSVPAGIQ